MDNLKKFEVFLEIARTLNQELGSIPILYGSLGLSKSIGKNLETNDIDILIEESVFLNSLNEVRQVMQRMSFILVDLQENEFHRDSLKVGISHDGDMIEFCGINPENLRVEETTAKYRMLTAAEYLATYKASSKDGYRIHTRQKKDGVKISLLESLINT